MEENEKRELQTNFESNVNQQNSNSEVKPRNKKLTILLSVIIIVLILAIGVCVGLWFAGDTTKIINNKEEVIKEENSKTEENKTSKKIDETKPWVYDADYLAGRTDKKLEEYVVSKELKAPYININSEDAKKANEEIKNMFEKSYTDNFNDYTIGKISYEYVETKNILSVVIYEVNCLVRGGGRRNIYTYAFNLDNLKYATFKDMCLACNIDEDIVKGQVQELADKSIFKESFEIENNYYIDNNGELRCVLNNEYVESGMFVFIRVMSNSVNIVDEESYNELYGTNSENLDEVINENKIIKHLAPSGWAGSSNHEIRLYSNGEVYHVVYSGEGISEEYIISKELIAENTSDIVSQKNGPRTESIIIIGENTKKVRDDESWIKFEEEQVLCKDFSFMSEYKNTVFETPNKKRGERYYRISFDENSNPTIYIENVGYQAVATYRKFYNVEKEGTKGNEHIIFNYRTLNETGDYLTGIVKYGNEDNKITLIIDDDVNREEIILYKKENEHSISHEVVTNKNGEQYIRIVTEDENGERIEKNIVMSGVYKWTKELRIEEDMIVNKLIMNIDKETEIQYETYIKIEDIKNSKNKILAKEIPPEFFHFQIDGFEEIKKFTLESNGEVSIVFEPNSDLLNKYKTIDGRYLIAKGVKNIYTIPMGNSGYGALVMVKNDGTVEMLSSEKVGEERIIEIERLNVENIDFIMLVNGLDVIECNFVDKNGNVVAWDN